MAYEIKIENLKELQDAFKKSPKIVDKELQGATKDAGKLILRTEKEEVPVKTGTLRRSITLDYKPISASIYPTVKYALPLHEGTRPHIILPVRKKALRFKVGNKVIYSKRVNHPGTAGNRFVERTVNKTDRKVNNIFEKCLEAIVNLIAK